MADLQSGGFFGSRWAFALFLILILLFFADEWGNVKERREQGWVEDLSEKAQVETDGHLLCF